MAHHVFCEWQARALSGEESVPLDEARRLVAAARAPAQRIEGRKPAFDFGQDLLTARNLVGLVVAGDTSCEILPKVDRDAPGDAATLRRELIRMLAVAHDVPIADDAATATDTQRHTLLEALIGRFAHEATEAVRRGLPRAYVAHEGDLPALRGRLDVARQFSTLAASSHRLACRYDEFSADIALNRVMKAAIVRLRRLARSHANQRALAELALVYADVADLPAALLRFDRVVVDRTNARWQMLLRLAQLILGDRFQNSAHGAGDGFALLFDMNVLFERYVARLLTPIAAARGVRLVAQQKDRRVLHPEGGGKAVFATSPDLRLVDAGTTRLVIDTKWKRLADPDVDAKRGVKQADLYQMMAYAQLYECDRLVLLYPHHAGLTKPLPARYRIGSAQGVVQLAIASVDVTSQAAARADLRRLVALLG